MMPNLLIALGAGAASALLFASMATASVLAILLFCLAPLPILIAALGWVHWTGLAAAILAAAGLGLVITPAFFLTYLIGVGLPAWWLGYLALLARPASGPTPDDLDWYPVGRLLAWAAVLAAVVVTAAIVTLGSDGDSYRNVLRNSFDRALPASPDAPWSTPEQRDRLLDLLVTVLPISAAVLATVVNVMNLWLAGRIVRVSGRLRRAWPDVAALQLPRVTGALLAVGCVGLVVADGLLGAIAGVVAASMTIAYAILGFAVLHTITRGAASRGAILGGTYALVLVLGWPVLGMTLLGLTDSAVDLRGRFANRPGPPPSPTTT
jgi:hypothetical protein